MKGIVAVAVLLCLAGAPRAAENDGLTGLDRKMMEVLTETRTSGSLVFHYEKGVAGPEALDKAVAMKLASFDEVARRLDMKFAGKIHLFLYRDYGEVRTRVGVGPGDPVCTLGTISVHLPCDALGIHQLTHLFVRQFPPVADSVMVEPFFAEGLATALEGPVEDVPLHTWARVYDERGVLPGLVDLRRKWPAGGPPRVNPWIVAGSFVAWLLERHGVPKFKAMYGNCLEFQRAYGRSFSQMEGDWREMVHKVAVDEKHAAWVRHTLAPPPAAAVPPWLTEGKWTALFDGKSLDGLEPEASGTWKVEDGHIVGECPGAGSALLTTRRYAGPVAVRAKVRLASDGAVRLLTNVRGDQKNAGILATWNTFLTRKAGAFLGNESVKIQPGTWVEILLVNWEGNGKLFMNGALLIDGPGELFTDPGAVGIGVNKGRIEVESLEVIQP